MSSIKHGHHNSHHLSGSGEAVDDMRHQSLDLSFRNRDIDRSLTPNRTHEGKIKGETVQEYLNFPDPQIYLIGFECLADRKESYS